MRSLENHEQIIQNSPFEISVQRSWFTCYGWLLAELHSTFLRCAMKKLPVTYLDYGVHDTWVLGRLGIQRKAYGTYKLPMHVRALCGHALHMAGRNHYTCNVAAPAMVSSLRGRYALTAMLAVAMDDIPFPSCHDNPRSKDSKASRKAMQPCRFSHVTLKKLLMDRRIDGYASFPRLVR